MSRKLFVLHCFLLSTGAFLGSRADAAPADGGLTSRPRPATKPAAPLAVGSEVRTAAGERRRVALPDGAVLFVNEKTIAKLETPRTLTLATGEVYLEAAPAAFIVRAAGGEVSGQQASFAVRIDKAGPAIDVTRGKVAVKGLAQPLHAGQRLAAGADAPGVAPRATQTLAWVRDLVCAAEMPLLPANEHAGGALVAIDPQGQEAKLPLRRFHIDVHIEDGFARTTIDQTYFNHHPDQLEGTFYFPLPPDASLSRLAMYVDGQLMEGGMAERDRARTVYETIRYTRRDPALLEWVDGSTFKMRVFPLQPRQEKRIVLSYSQRLGTLNGQATYRFPAGHTLHKVRDWSLHVRVKDGAGWAWESPSHPLRAQIDKQDLRLFASAENAATNRDVVLITSDPRAADPADEAVRFATAEHEGARYLLARFRPKLGGKMTGRRRDWVFLVETSGDRDPLLARVQIEVLRHLLSYAEPDDTFAVLTAGTRVKAFSKAPLPVTADNISAAVAFLEGAHLIGALDLGQALTEAADVLRPGTSPYLVHLGSGIAAMGERRDDVLAKRLPAGTTYVGVGVGRRWARGLMKTAAERTGGHFTQINPDEPIAWRAFELIATLNTPRVMDVAIVDASGQAKFHAFNTAVAQGEEVAAVTRVVGDAPLPASVIVKGTLEGKPFARVLPVKGARADAAYLPRTWAKLEIDRLLADDALKHKEPIIALSKAMYVITPYTSLLVLENEDQYTQYKVDRGRKDHWALYPLAERIPVVVEPDPDAPDPREAKAGKRPARQVLQSIASRGGPGEADGAGKEGRPITMFGFSAPETVASRFKTGDAATALALDYQLGTLPDIAERQAIVGNFNETQLLVSSAGTHTGSFQIGNGVNNDRGLVGSIVLKDPNFTPTNEPVAAGQIGGNDEKSSSTRFRGLVVSRPKKGSELIRMFDLGGKVERIFGTTILESSKALEPQLNPNRVPLAWYALNVTAPRPEGDAFRRMLRQIEQMPKAGPMHQRPTLMPEDKVFFDLVAYAPGLHTSDADVLSVLDAEALPGPWNKPGKVDSAARKLLDSTRVEGWQVLTRADADTTIHFDDRGRFTCERTLPFGLRERVVCDGKTLTHLYPQLALAARRDVSRFHRADLADLDPWYVPPADELARGADVRLAAEGVVAIVPHGVGGKDAAGKEASYHVTHLVFADGRLAERRLVRMPAGEVVSRQTLSPGGTIRMQDGQGKEQSVRPGRLAAAAAPALTADTTELLVLPLPYRTQEHVRKVLKLENKADNVLTLKEGLPLFLAHVARGDASAAQQLFNQVFHAREQRQLGYYVLLASCGANLDSDHGNVLAEHIDHPLAQYLALHSSPVLRKHASQWAVGSVSWQDGFLQQLAVAHALLQRWQNDRVLKGDPTRAAAETRRALAYVEKNDASRFGWTLLCLIADRADKDAALHARIAELWPLFAKSPGLTFAARYEHARSLWKAGKKDEARQRFRTLVESAITEGTLPAIDADLRAALVADDAWGTLMRLTARRLVEQQRRLAVLALARQCWDLGDPPLAGALLSTALDGIGDPAERTTLAIAAFDFLRDTAQLPEADRLLQTLLADPKLARQSLLWRMGQALAEQRDMSARAIECLEKALDLEAEHPPEVIDLQTARADYLVLLGHYAALADAMVALKLTPPADFRSRVVRAADRWRAVDNDPTAACEAAAKILKRLGERELAWDYLTTPVGLHPNESGPWSSLAALLGKQGEPALADRAYRAASEAEPTDAQIVWDRAQNLKQLGKHREAQELVRRIAEGTWQPRFEPLQAQARNLLRSE